VGVKDLAIQEWLQANPGLETQQLDGLKSGLKCGTQCGSCVPQLKRIIALKTPDKGLSAAPSLTL
jgi:assimilatory nitrate reductase catalytic subunit